MAGYRVLAASSGGGHWVELRRLDPALLDYEVHYLSVKPDYAGSTPIGRFHLVRDATRWNPIGVIVLSMQVLFYVVRIRPQVVISTGAAPGVFAILFGKAISAKTIWVDSLANVEELSHSGKLVREGLNN